MASMHSMSWRLSKLTPSIVRLWSRGFVTSQFTPILSPNNRPPKLLKPVPNRIRIQTYSISPQELEQEQAKIRKSQEYFNQYIEEYYEPDEYEEESHVICSPFNARHGYAVSEALRKVGKQKDDQPRKCTIRRSFGWFQIELGKIQVHVMGEEARQRFDLESLWGVNDEEEEVEEIPLIPPPRKHL
ncbi:unnamed protein product [Nippostrongylus brasiliensis]|uniref:Protein Iojap, mitochondrial n=1 Tax=Nippostrongylus brasiliensis TaxID=27835 RepID=A0A0N4YN96_NIPBR|nr:unnamed protein product [Nippostrongylus brasiliensis]